MRDEDIKKEFNEAYQTAASGWTNYLEEARRDWKCFLGNQWNEQEKSYLKSQRRVAMVFNRVRRAIKIITGYQRKNRLSLKIDPVGMEDDNVSTQMTAVVMDTMRCANGYNIMSEAFENGSLISGLNLVEPYINWRGDIAFKRWAHNQFLLDPSFQERDLSDCGYVLHREMVTTEEAKSLLPGHDRAIETLPNQHDEKFPNMPHASKRYGKDLLAYDEFYRKSMKNATFIVHRQTGEEMQWEGTKKDLERLLFQYPVLTTITRPVQQIELIVFIQGEKFYEGPDLHGFQEYRFVPVMGFYYPEHTDDRYKLQGVVRCIRDPQKEFNKRISQEIDIIESQINTGYDAVEESVVNPESLFESGQGKVTWLKGPLENPLGLNAIRKKQPVDIPQGLFMLNESIDKLLTEIPGINDELFGTETKDMPGILSKMRQGAALTILQDLFDNYRMSKRLLGRKILILAQNEYSPQKVMRILNQQPHPQFFNADLTRYDVMAQEGLLTDSQRQMYYEELKALQQLGAPIPWTAIIEAAPIQLKEHIKRHIAMAEQQANQQAQSQQQAEELTRALMQSQIAENVAQAQERRAQIQENIANAALDRARTANEVQKATQDNLQQAVEIARDIQNPKSRKVTKR